MTVKEERYLQAPLSLLRDFFGNPAEVLNKVIRIGIYKYADRYSNYQEYGENIAKQLMYGFYRDKNFKTKIHHKIQQYADRDLIDLDTDYNGFSGETFNPEWELEGLCKILDSDKELRNYAINYHGIKMACSDLNLNISVPNIDRIIKDASDILKSTPEDEPWVMISKARAFDYRDHKKTDFELAQFAAHIAIKSIIGVKPLGKTNKRHITARMFGYASVKHLPAKMSEKIQPFFNKYSTRYWMDKVLQMLELYWGVKIYSHSMRGFYVSTSKTMDMNNLAIKAEEQSIKNKIAALKQSKKEAREKALQHIYSTEYSRSTAGQQQLK